MEELKDFIRFQLQGIVVCFTAASLLKETIVTLLSVQLYV